MRDILYKENGIWKYDLQKLVSYIEEISCKFSGKNHLQKHLGVYDGFLDSVEKANDIKFKYNFTFINKKDPRFKAIYQDYNWCYQKYFIEGKRHDEMAEDAGCSKRVIEKWCCEKHRLTNEYRRKYKKVSKTQRSLIIGSLLGDGHIDKRLTQPIFIVSHAENQKDYLFWKYDIMKDFCNQPPSYIAPKVRKFKKGEFMCQGLYRISTRIQDCFLEFRNMTKKELIDNLDELSLSIFILDDGSRENSNWNLCLAGIDLRDREYFIKIIKDKFNLDFKICNHDNRYARVSADSSRKLDKIILNNIPNELDIIKCKILNRNISKEINRKIISFENKNVFLSDFCKDNNLCYKKCHKIFSSNQGITGELLLHKIRG